MTAHDAEARASRVAERVADAWYSYQGGSDSEIAVGVVAALALTERGNGGTDPAKHVLAASDEEIIQLLREIWSLFWTVRPELARLVGPFAGWLNEETPDRYRVRAAVGAAKAAAKAGLLGMAHNGSLRDTDVIGVTYLHMRSTKAKQARGEFYTPADISKVMALMTMDTGFLAPGQSIAEPAAGTGGMLRAAAEVIRERGMDPADFWWVANDISPVSVAGLAVNCHLWDLGPHVIIGIADTLREPDWYVRAQKEQQAAIEHRNRLAGQAKMLAMLRSLDGALEAVAAEAKPGAAA